MRVCVRLDAPLLLAMFLFTGTALAQSGVGVDLDDVVDNRISHEMLVGSLELRVKLHGNGLDKAAAARIVVKEARDDRGNVLSDPKHTADFTPRDVNSGLLPVSLKSPARAASSVKVKGTVELYVPTRDPNAVVKVDKALAKLDAPLSSKGLKAAKIDITPLSVGGYKAARAKTKLDDAKIAEIRAEAKKQGAPEKEVEMAIELAKAMDAMDETPSEGAVLLSADRAAFDRILRVEILGSDGKPLDIPSRSTSTRGDASIMTLQPSAAPPRDAALEFHLLTDKAKVSFPFELNVTLP